MARGRKKTDDSPVGSADRASLLASQLRDSAIKEFGESNVLSMQGFLDSIYGIPLPNNLPLQHMLGVDVLALGRAITLVGAAGTSKSSLGWYMAKLILQAGGLVVFMDAEQKTNPDQVRAIIDDDALMGRVVFTKVKSVDEMMGGLQYYAKMYPKLAPNKDVPLMFLIDSINGVTSEDTANKLEKGEDVNYGAARNIAKMQEFFQAFLPNHLEPNPFTLVLINHQKKDVEQARGPAVTKHEPGGTHKEFMYTWKLEMSKTITNESVEGMTPIYKMKVLKSSLGQTYKHSLEIPYESFIDENGLEHIAYNWDVALVNLLSNDKISKTKLSEIFHFSRTGNKCTSKTLGLEDVSPDVMGKAIHANKELCTKLQDFILRIRRKRKLGETIDVIVSATIRSPGESLPEGPESGFTDTETEGEQ
jgi:hypothetical protein